MEITAIDAPITNALFACLELRAPDIARHSQRVANLAVQLARSLGITNPVDLRQLYTGALLHDIGKIGLPDRVLFPSGPLTAEEQILLAQHPTLALPLLAHLADAREAGQVVLHHHERWDGNGCPGGLYGQAIPILARICAGANAYDHLASGGKDHSAVGQATALRELSKGSGSLYDPRVVKALMGG
jgi:putative nucleotidyltransferase with HDIG domain